MTLFEKCKAASKSGGEKQPDGASLFEKAKLHNTAVGALGSLSDDINRYQSNSGVFLSDNSKAYGDVASNKVWANSDRVSSYSGKRLNELNNSYMDIEKRIKTNSSLTNEQKSSLLDELKGIQTTTSASNDYIYNGGKFKSQFKTQADFDSWKKFNDIGSMSEEEIDAKIAEYGKPRENYQANYDTIVADKLKAFAEQGYYDGGIQPYSEADRNVQEYEAENKPYYNALRLQKYKNLMSGEDFADMSKLTDEYLSKYNDDSLTSIISSPFNTRGVTKQGTYDIEANGTDEQKAIYRYLINKGDIEKAKEYKQIVQNELNYTEGEKRAQGYKDWGFLGYAKGAIDAGLDQFESGLVNVFNPNEAAVSPTQFASSDLRNSINTDIDNDFLRTVAGGAYDLTTTLANQVPSFAASALSNAILPGSGALAFGASMGASAKGNAYQQALREGYTQDEASAYSTLIAVSETTLQTLLGGIGQGGLGATKLIGKGISKVTPKFANAAAEVVDGVMKKIAVQPTTKAILSNLGRYATSGLNEGIEEYTQEILEPVYRNICFDENNEIKPFTAQALYNGVLGALSAGFLGFVGTVANTTSDYRTAKEYQDFDIERNGGQKFAPVGTTSGGVELYHPSEATAALSEKKQKSVLTAQLANEYANIKLDINGKVAENRRINNDIGTTTQKLDTKYNDNDNRYFVKTVEANGKVYDVVATVGKDGNSYKLSLENSSTAATDEAERAQYIPETGKRVTVDGNNLKIDSVQKTARNDDTVVKLSDGTVSRLSDVEFTDPITQNAYKEASGFLDENSANEYIYQFENNVKDRTDSFEISQFNQAFKAARDAGIKGTPTADFYTAHPEFNGINPEILTSAYRVGAEYKKNYAQYAPRTVSKNEEKVITKLSKALGVSVEFADTLDENSNGYYKDGKIYIARDADNPATVVFSHEVTHRMQETSPELYKEFRDKVIGYLKTNDGAAFSERFNAVKAQYERVTGKTFTENEIYDEIVANSTEAFLLDSEFAQKICSENRNLGQRILNAIKKILNEISRLLGNYNPKSYEARMLKESEADFEAARDLWGRMLAETGKAENTAENTAENKNTAAESDGVKYAIKEGMTEAERYNELKDKKIRITTPNYEKLNVISEYTYVEKLKSFNAQKPLLIIAKSLGISNLDLKNSEIKNTFKFSAQSQKSSINHQLEYGGSYQNYAKALSCLSKLIKNAELVEIHNDYKSKNSFSAEGKLLRTYVLISAFSDNGVIIPIALEVKEYQSTGNNLYIVVSLEGIKKESAVIEQGEIEANNTHEISPELIADSTISLTQLFSKINTQDKKFLKYVPDEFLSEEQITAKREAQEFDYKKYGRYADVFENENDTKKFSLKDTPLIEETKAYKILQEYAEENSANESKAKISRSISELEEIMSSDEFANAGFDEAYNIRTDLKALKAGFDNQYDYLVSEEFKRLKKEYEYGLAHPGTRSRATSYIKERINAEEKRIKLETDASQATPRQNAQFAIIQKANPMFDDYHVGIRSPKDIKTFAEVVDDNESFNWGDFSAEDARKALKKGSVRVYSSYPIKSGVFVSTSFEQALEYAGMDRSKVHSRTVALDSVAWINGDEGQYAKVYGTPDIVKFSLKDVFPTQADLVSENIQLKAMVESLQQEMKLTQGHKVQPKRVQALASEILREYKSSYSLETLSSNLEKVFNYIADGEAVGSTAMQMLADLSKAVIEQSSAKDTKLYDEYKDMRDEIRTTKIYVSPKQKAELDYIYGSYNEFRRNNFGRLNLTTDENADAIPVEAFVLDIADRYSGLFGDIDNMTDLELLPELERALDLVYPQYINPYGMDIDSYAYDLASVMLDKYFETPEIKTFADKKLAELNKVKAHYRNRLAEYRRESKQAYDKKLAEIKAENKSKAAEIRTKRDEKIAQVKAQARETAAQKTLRQRKTAEKNKYNKRIRENAMELYKWLSNPTDKKHVPEALRESALRFLSTIDFDSGKLGAKKRNDWNNVMRNFALMLNSYEKNLGEDEVSPDSFFNDLDPNYLPRLNEFILANDSTKKLADLNNEQLRELDYLVSVLKRTITEADKMRSDAKNATVKEVAQGTIDYLNNKKEKKAQNDIQKLIDGILNFDMLDARSFFRTLGENGMKIYEAFRNGFNKRTSHIKEASEYTQALLKNVNDIDKWTGKNTELHTFKLKTRDTNGRYIEKNAQLTTAQMMTIYALSRRGQALYHLLKGGIVLDDIKSGGKVISQKDTYHLSKDDIAAISKALTPKQREIARGMQAFLSEECSDWGNEVSMEMYGYKKYTEDNYFPINVNGNNNSSDILAQNNPNYAVKNKGFTKATQRRASASLQISDIFDVYTKHIADMATYNAFVVPLADALKWYNYKQDVFNSDGSIRDTISLRGAMERAYGKQAKDYFLTLIKDINDSNNMDSQTNTGKLSDKMLSNFKSAAVGANFRVAFQQPTAYLRAAAMIDPKYLATGVMGNPVQNAELAKKYSEIAWWKSQGYYETSIGRGLKEMLIGQQSKLDAVREKSMWLAQKADEMTWGVLWNACSLEIADTTSLKKGTEEFNEAVGKRLSDVIDQTQVVDTVLHRSQAMRSKSTIMKMEMAFLSEPTKSYNLLRNALLDAQDGIASGKDVGKKVMSTIGRTATVYLLTDALTAAAAAISDAFRDDDEYKKGLQKWIDNFVANFVGNVNPLAAVPFVKDAISLIQGFDLERTDLSALTSTADFLKKVWSATDKVMEGEGDKVKLFPLIKSALKIPSQFTGVPIYNLIREFETVYNFFAPQNIGNDGASSKDMAQYYYDAILENDKTRAETLYKDMISRNSLHDEGSVQNTIANALREKDERIKLAAEYRNNGNQSGYLSILNEIKAEGFKQDIVIRAINQTINEMNKSESTSNETKYATAQKTFKYSDVTKSLDTGKTNEAQKAIDYIYIDKISDGTEPADAARAIRSALTSTYKPLYINGTAIQRKAIEDKLTSIVINGDKAYSSEDFKKWLK